MEVGAAFVRIRPYVAERDARSLAALDRLTHDIASAFDRFHEDIGADTNPPRLAAIPVAEPDRRDTKGDT